ncbi:hypothetical protein CON64_09655 [Bacillus pseudomycoides]|nr:hypothetical protein CON64_09655 [Bacillus pseudomycoides]
MITIEKWTAIRALKQEGHSIRSITKLLNVSRNTVRKALKAEKVPTYQRKEKEDKLIVPFEEIIREYVGEGLIGTRIFKELQAKGYKGSQATVYRFLRTLEQEKQSKQKTVRFETDPGEQAQFDWSPYQIKINGTVTQVYCFLLILGYSRKKYMTFSLSQSIESVLESLEEGIRSFGGVPRQIVIDNAKQLVLSHPRDETAIYHPKLLELAGTYRFSPYACQTYWPRTKGKVERPFFYIEHHFIRGNEFMSVEELIQKGYLFLKQWEKEPNKTTLIPPSIRYLEEVQALSPLPNTSYIHTMKETRRVSWDCLISYKGVKYSVPHLYAGKQIWILPSHGHILKLYNENGKWIDEHMISNRKGSTIYKEEHYEGLNNKLPKSLPKLRELFLEKFPSGESYVGLLQQEVKANHGHRFQKILELRHYYEDTIIDAVLQQAVMYQRTEVEFIQNLLRSSPRKITEMPKIDKLPTVKTETRSLNYYSQLLH